MAENKKTDTLKLTELTFQLIVESSPSAFVLVNKEGRIAYVNKQTENLFRYSRTEVVGQLVEKLIPERFRGDHPKFRSLFFKSPVVRAMGAGRELYALRSDDTEFPVEIGLNPVVTSDGTLTLASIIDISERKNAEQQFRLVVESVPNAIVLVGKNGVIDLVNRQAEQLFKYSQGELIGKNIDILIPDRFSGNHRSHVGSFLSMPKIRPMGAGRDLVALRKDGTEVQVEIGLNPIEIGEDLKVLASIVDVTERKAMEAISKRKVELEIRNKELEQFAYIASHDLQEPLRTIINYMNVFEEDYQKKLDTTAKLYLNSIKEASGRMSNQIKSLLHFSRLGKGKVPTLINIKKIIDQTLADIQKLIESSGAQFSIGTMQELRVYEAEMRTLFQNLIVNAIKYRKRDITPQIRIDCVEYPEEWLFTISDNGIGIEQKFLKRIFEIFQKLHPQSEYEGSGIGLATCKRIVELHSGRIWAESEFGKGSTFHFTITKNIEYQ